MLNVHRGRKRKKSTASSWGETTERGKTGRTSQLYSAKRSNTSLDGDYKLKDSDASSNTSLQVMTRYLFRPRLYMDRKTPPLRSTRPPTISTKCPEVPLALNMSRLSRNPGRWLHLLFCQTRPECQRPLQPRLLPPTSATLRPPGISIISPPVSGCTRQKADHGARLETATGAVQNIVRLNRTSDCTPS